MPRSSRGWLVLVSRASDLVEVKSRILSLLGQSTFRRRRSTVLVSTPRSKSPRQAFFDNRAKQDDTRQNRSLQSIVKQSRLHVELESLTYQMNG